MIETLIDADEVEMHEMMEADYKRQAFMMDHPKLYALYSYLWECPKYYITCYIICRVLGHDLVDEGYGGPDSGCMDIHCKRCGWGQYIQLY